MHNTLICTVGTSLLEGNLKGLSETTRDKPGNWIEIKRYYNEKNWNLLARELSTINPLERICGAEINTIEGAKNKKWLSLENLIFLVSDTDKGIATGMLLRHYYQDYRKDLNIKTVEYKVIEALQDEEPKKFKINGLRNLVRVIGDYLQRFGKENCAIDSTGGYKAQIAFAVLIGQAINIPVYYKHEKFSEIIDFPPLPVSLDYDLLGKNAHILDYLEKGHTLAETDLDEIDPKLKVFFDEIDVDGVKLFALNAIGQLYMLTFRLRFPRAVKLTDASPADKKEPAFRDDHYPKGFKNFVSKVWKEISWIKTCHSLPYFKQKAIKGVEFFVWEDGENYQLVGTYQDKDKFGARYGIITTDHSRESLNWAAEFLNRKYDIQ